MNHFLQSSKTTKLKVDEKIMMSALGSEVNKGITHFTSSSVKFYFNILYLMCFITSNNDDTMLIEITRVQ